MQTQPTIIITESADYSIKALETYQSFGKVQLALTPNDAAVINHLEHADILVTRLGKMMDERWLWNAKNLSCIVSPTTGLNHIDLVYAQQRNIQVISLKGETAFLESIPSTAEFTWALLLAATRKLIPAANDVRLGHWAREKWKGHNLHGKTLGIIGFGRVGRQVALFAKAFGMKVLAFNNQADTTDENDAIICHEIKDVLQHADMVSLHIPSSGNFHFFSEAMMMQCKPGTILINTSRGDVWDEAAVARLAVSGHFSAVATDVLESELDAGWKDASPLMKAAENCNHIIITPHIGGATIESMHATEEFVAEKCKAWWQVQAAIA